jgi:ABC-type Fe3+-hydroxamate transport system substrate-binding protein
VAIGALVLILCAACHSASSSTGSSSTTTSDQKKKANPSACTLVTPTQIRTITDADVTTPTVVNHGATTTCTYPASNSSQSVIIEFEGNATAASFDANQKKFAATYGAVSTIPGLGQQAYSATVNSGSLPVHTVAVFIEPLQLVVTSSASLKDVTTLAEEVLLALSKTAPRVRP